MPSTSRRGAAGQQVRGSAKRPAASAVVSPSKWAIQLGDEVLLCRDLGHTWMPHTASFDPRSHTYRQRLRCNRCTTIRVRLLAKNGEVLASHYDYPENYLAPAGVGRLDAGIRNTLRLTSITRVINAAADAGKKTADVTNVVNINDKKQ